MDFYILALMRSGSHMLASALDSHSQISCGEIFRTPYPAYPWLGAARTKPVRGRIISYSLRGGVIAYACASIIRDGTKVICLTRDDDEAALQSLVNSPQWHSTEPWQRPELVNMPRADMLKARLADKEAMIAEAKKHDHLMLSYERLTGNKDIREINPSDAEAICSFLGVSHEPLRTKFHKPTTPEAVPNDGR